MLKYNTVHCTLFKHYFYAYLFSMTGRNSELCDIYNKQGCPERIALYRRLYGIYTVCFLTITIPCNCNLVKSFFVHSLNEQFNDIFKAPEAENKQIGTIFNIVIINSIIVYKIKLLCNNNNNLIPSAGKRRE